tara:strand:- start:1077 stop:2333 length:1257 start_codon:yes stop_codon:yes gene_type:complete
MNKQKLSYTLFTFLVVLVLSCTPTSYLANFTPPSTWPTVSKTEDELIEYFDKNKNNLNPIEGIWNYSSNINVRNRLTGEQSGTRTVQNTMQLAIIKKDFTSSREFNAVIISSEGSHWNYPGRVKAIFKSTAYKNSYAVKWFQKHYNETSSNFFIDEDGLMKGKFEFTIQNNFLANIEASLMKSYPPYDDFSYSQSNSSIEKSVGSGFLISENGIVATNYHIVENAQKIEILFPEKNITKQAMLRLRDINNDLAVLEIKDFDFNKVSSNHIPYTLARVGDVKVGQEVFTLGFPLGSIMGSKTRLSTGRINSIYGVQEDPRLFQIGNSLQPGNSGGPLFNEKGELVGVVVSGLNAKYFYENRGIIPQNMNFAVKVSYLENLLAMIPDSDAIIYRDSKISSLSMEELVEELNPFVVQIMAY